MISIGTAGPNSIQMSKGDYFIRSIRLTQNGEPYCLAEDEEAVFTVRRQPNESHRVLLQKSYSEQGADVFPLEITLSDVEDIPVGRYVYDIRLKKIDVDGFITPMRPMLFELWEVVG